MLYIYNNDVCLVTKRLCSISYEEFKASSGWLERWKVFYRIFHYLVEGESVWYSPKVND